MRVLLAIGGSTNGIIHRTAMAGRLGIEIDLDPLDAMGEQTPVRVDGRRAWVETYRADPGPQT